MNKSVEERAKAGVFWSGSITAVSQVVSFGLGVCLARLLVPGDFGVTAGLIVFTEIAHSIVGSGFVAALIQRKDVTKEHYATAFTIQVGLAVLSYICLIAVSHWVALFFRSTTSGQVLVVMAVSVLILPFISIPTAILRREMDFRVAGLMDVGQQLSSGGTAVLLAYFGWGLWSLVWGRLVGYLAKAILMISVVRWRPRLYFRLDLGRALFSFSSKMVAANLLNDIASNIDYVMVGRFLGPTQLGFYERAYYLMILPTTRVTAAINAVFFSAFSRVNDDASALKEGVLKALYYVALVTFPVSTLLFWIAPAFIPAIYGQQWLPSVQPLQIMSFAGVLFSIEPIAASAITARGYVGFEVRRQLIYVIILILGVFIGSYWGLRGVSVAVVFAAFTFSILLLRVLRNILKITVHEVLGRVKPVLGGCVIMSLALLFEQWIQPAAFISEFPTLLISILTGCLVYAVTLFVFWSRSENKIGGNKAKSYREQVHELVQRLLSGGLFTRT